MSDTREIADILFALLCERPVSEAGLRRASGWFEQLDTPLDRRSFMAYARQLQRGLPADSPLATLRTRWRQTRREAAGFDSDTAHDFLQDYRAHLDPNLLFRAPITAGYAHWKRQDLARGFAFASSVQQAWSLLLCDRGGARLRSGGRDIQLKPHDVLLVAPGAVNTLHPRDEEGDWGYHWVIFHPASRWREWLDWPGGAAGVARLRLAPDRGTTLATIFGDLDRVLQGEQQLGAELAHNLLEQLLLRCRSTLPEHGRQSRDPRIERAREFIATHYAEAFTLEEVAGVSNLSVSRLAGLFRQQCGLSVLGYRDELRMAEAARLLRESRLDIASVGARVGYGDPAYFSRAFSRHVGVAPRSYQQQA